MILTHGANSLGSEYPKYGEGVTIDGKYYPSVIMPDGSEWLAYNLDYGASGAYYDNDESTYGWNGLKYGKLYTWNEAVAAGSAISGWHLPTFDEWAALANAVGGTIAGTKLKSTSGWYESGNGTDDYGFNGVPSGYCQLSFMDVDKVAVYWTSTEIGTYDAYDRGLSYNSERIGGAWGTNKDFLFSVRLVKDV